MKNQTLTLKVFLLAIGVLIAGRMSYAQSALTIDASQLITNFNFTDSEGNRDDSYKPLYTGAYNFGYSYYSDFGMFITFSAGMRKAGATMVYDASNYNWDLQYGQLKLGTGYEFGAGRLKPYLGVSFYYAILLKASQTLNNEDFDIIDSGAVKTSDYGLYFTPGVKFMISDAISLYTEYSYLMGLNNIETGSDGQISKVAAHVMTIGLAFTFNEQ